MKHYFLGAAAGFTAKEMWRHTFAIGLEKDRRELSEFLAKKYGGEAVLCKNGRSALCLALKECFEPGDGVIVNGFTCYAVYEAIKAARLVPVFADISFEDLNYNTETLKKLNAKPDASRHASSRPSLRGSSLTRSPLVAKCLESSGSCVQVRGIIVQNTLGNPVDIRAVERFAKQHDLTIIEDLAHSVGVRYTDGREAGTVGAATALSFGKDKSIDTVSGGAVVFRSKVFAETEGFRSAAARDGAPAARGDGPAGRGPKFGKNLPHRPPRPSDNLRARFYPMFGALYRGLSHVHLNGILMRCLLKIHWVERSADNKLDLERKIAKFEAKLALKQLKNLRKAGEPPLREFYLVRDREEALKKLANAGYYFGGFWYERPVSPERYYKKVHFPEKECPNAVYVSEHIMNLPSYYSKQELNVAREIIKEYLIKEGENG